MPYLIDGHNLIAALPDIDLSDEHDEAQLVIKLRGFAARKKTKCTVIFDRGLPGGASHLSTPSVKVVFAAGPSDADAVIKRRIRKTPDAANWTLVSSDRDIVNYARRQRMNQMTAAEFARLLQHNDQNRPASGLSDKPAPSQADTDHWLKRFGGDQNTDNTADTN